MSTCEKIVIGYLEQVDLDALILLHIVWRCDPQNIGPFLVSFVVLCLNS